VIVTGAAAADGLPVWSAWTAVSVTGNATCSGIVADRCAAMAIAGEADEVIQLCPDALKLIVPV
jgi:hypothetical protein